MGAREPFCLPDRSSAGQVPLRPHCLHPDHIRFRLRSRLSWGGAGAGHAFHVDFDTASPPPPYNGSDCWATAAPASAEFDSALRLPLFCAELTGRCRGSLVVKF